MILKQTHCIPTCTIPNMAAKQPKWLISLQHSISLRVVGRASMEARAPVHDNVPRRIKYGERPAEERREMIR